jgi:undecaprenyl diphosphate synthase
MSLYLEKIDKAHLPQHVAVIMDGNGRWAKMRGYERIFGHTAGVKSVREVTEAAAEIGLEYLTLYAFSTENWDRPQEEVGALMELLVDSIQKETPTLNKNNIRLMAIGNIDRLPTNVREKLQVCIDQTAKNTGLTLVLALSYSSRWEITNAVSQICKEIQEGKMQLNDISSELVSSHLTTKAIPDPDLMIRTSGELRISNFLLWQLAYSEFYFTDTQWPDFRKDDFYKAIYDFQHRERRFGK